MLTDRLILSKCDRNSPSSDQSPLPPVRIDLSLRTTEEHLQTWFPEFTCSKMTLKPRFLSVSGSWIYAACQTTTESLAFLLEVGVEKNKPKPERNHLKKHRQIADKEIYWYSGEDLKAEWGIFLVSLQAWWGCIEQAEQRPSQARPAAQSSPQPHHAACGTTWLGAVFLCIARGSICTRYWSKLKKNLGNKNGSKISICTYQLSAG